MSKQWKALAWTAAITTAIVGGCSQFGSEAWKEATPESQGYRWVGQGEPVNFGSAYSFCQQTLRAQTEGARLQGGAGILTSQPGGETTIPGYYQTMQSTRGDIVDRRQFQGCMEAQGWESAETKPAIPSGPPTSPARPASPVEPSK
jgi:hypothetical protein